MLPYAGTAITGAPRRRRGSQKHRGGKPRIRRPHKRGRRPRERCSRGLSWARGLQPSDMVNQQKTQPGFSKIKRN